MVYKRFTIFVIVRLFLILANIIGISLLYHFLDEEQLVFTFFVLFILLVFQVTEMIRYVNTTNRLLSSFMLNIKHRDFNVSFSKEKDRSSFTELYYAFNEILKTFKEIKIDKEIQYRFLNGIVELIKIGIIAINQDNKIVLMNTAAEKLLGVMKPGRWEQLAMKSREFTKAVDSINPNGSVYLESGKTKSSHDLTIQLTSTLLMGNQHKIITFQNIKSEIEQKETEAWIRLIRTLNHEIMNSTTPISSLSETILMILQNEQHETRPIEALSPNNLEDVISSVNTIRNRSNNLYEFVNEYRKLTRIPEPKKENLDIKSYLNDIGLFMKAELDRANVTLNIEDTPSGFSLYADPALLQQLLINLIKNSIEALLDTNDPKITIRAYVADNHQPALQIQDNGKGIDPDVIDDIFIPFFSTKEEGSGIGLSLSRQIMRLHGGTMVVESEKGTGTAFTLRF